MWVHNHTRRMQGNTKSRSANHTHESYPRIIPRIIPTNHTPQSNFPGWTRYFETYPYIYIYIYIYIHAIPQKPTSFAQFTRIYSVFCLFCCQKRHYILKCFSIFGHLNLMMFEMTCVDMRACFAAICSVFEHSIVVLADVYS